MAETKVLIIDEDVVARHAIARVLNPIPGVKIGLCSDPDQGARLVEETNPDLLMLSIEEEGSRGEEFFYAIRQQRESLPIVVLAPKTRAGAAAAIKALRAGAAEVVTKPVNGSLMLFSGRHLDKRVPPVLNLASGSAAPTTGDLYCRCGNEPPPPTAASRPPPSRTPVRLVVIGGCTGGPRALHELVPNLPEGLNVPVVVVQHLPRHYTGELARSLAARSAVPVQEAGDGSRLKAGTVWIAPGGHHTELRREGSRSILRLHRGPRVHEARPSVDVLFRSAANIYDSGVLGVLLSGWGRDGLEGGERIREAGGEILVQDPASALAPGLVESALRSGLAECVYPPAELASAIAARTAERGRGMGPKRRIAPAPLFMAP